MIKKFIAWYQTKVLENLIASAIILYLQIPHTITAADCFFALGLGLVHVNPFMDFFLYGIDLLEAVPILGVSVALYVEAKRRWVN